MRQQPVLHSANLKRWPATSARFVLLGIGVSLALFGVLRLPWIETHALLPFTLAQAALAVRMFGVPALPIAATLACSGADAIALCLGAVLAYPARWPSRLSGAAGGVVMILALNVLRIGTLGRAIASRFWFDTLHLYVWPAILTLAIAGYVLAWMRVADRSPRAAPALDAPPRRSTRFVVLAAVFLVVFVAAAPLYLQNASVLIVAGFIARAAAAILTAAGVHAFAAANVLWMPRGGFAVTEECISTPLIPVYLAAVCAYSPTWKRIGLGVIAAAPLFAALGVLRLLVVALPGSIAFQTFFVHAFYQILSGVVVVGAGALWRHGRTSAPRFAFAGVGAGVLVMLVAGPFYSRAVVALTGPSLNDPQGAIAMLPSFQIALFLALWAATFAAAEWKRLAAGLAALIVSQVAVLLAVNALFQRNGLTPAVRDVRGWAVAVPVLIFVAMVKLGRPRR